jgi:hypothetical protein
MVTVKNQIIQDTRKEIKEGLLQLEDKHRNLFLRMYSFNDLNKDINEVIDNMEEEKLDVAASQIERTLSTFALGSGTR